MKGQLNIEFVISILVFGVLAAYIVFFVYGLLPGLSFESDTEKIKAKAYQISDLLFFDPGMRNGSLDTNWVRDNVSRVGLSLKDEPGVLNYTKLIELNNTNDKIVRDGFFADYSIRIILENASEQNPAKNVLVVVDNGNATAQAVNIIRVAPARMTDGKYEKVRLTLTVWRI